MKKHILLVAAIFGLITFGVTSLAETKTNPIIVTCVHGSCPYTGTLWFTPKQTHKLELKCNDHRTATLSSKNKFTPVSGDPFGYTWVTIKCYPKNHTSICEIKNNDPLRSVRMVLSVKWKCVAHDNIT